MSETHASGKCLKHTRLQPERFVVYRTENA